MLIPMSVQRKSLSVNPGSQIYFMYEGVWGYYARRPMRATVLRVKRNSDGGKLEIQPDELNLPRWIHERDVLRVEPNGSRLHGPPLAGLRNFLRVIVSKSLSARTRQLFRRAV